MRGGIDTACAAQGQGQWALTCQDETAQAHARSGIGGHRPRLWQAGQTGRADHAAGVQHHAGGHRALAVARTRLGQHLQAAGIADREFSGCAQVGVERSCITAEYQHVVDVVDRHTRARSCRETARTRCGEGQDHGAGSGWQGVGQDQGRGAAQGLGDALRQRQGQAGLCSAQVDRHPAMQGVGRCGQGQLARAGHQHHTRTVQCLNGRGEGRGLTWGGRPPELARSSQVIAECALRAGQTQRAAAQSAGSHRHARRGGIGRQRAAAHREHQGAQVGAAAQHIGGQLQIVGIGKHRDMAWQAQHRCGDDAGRPAGA